MGDTHDMTLIDLAKDVDTNDPNFVSLSFLFKIYNHILRPQWYLRNIYGPPGGTLLEGSKPNFNDSEPGAYHRQWHQAYGHTFRFNSFFSVWRLHSAHRPDYCNR